MRAAKSPPNVPVTLLLIIMCTFKKAPRQRLSWLVLVESRAASKWEKPLGSMQELCLVQH